MSSEIRQNPFLRDQIDLAILGSERIPPAHISPWRTTNIHTAARSAALLFHNLKSSHTHCTYLYLEPEAYDFTSNKQLTAKLARAYIPAARKGGEGSDTILKGWQYLAVHSLHHTVLRRTTKKDLSWTRLQKILSLPQKPAGL